MKKARFLFHVTAPTWNHSNVQCHRNSKIKVALVTGGSRGIGAAIAKRLAADDASVALTYSTAAEKANKVVRDIERTGGQFSPGLRIPAEFQRTDLTQRIDRSWRFGDPEEVAAMVAYLATPAAEFATEASLKIDGGLVV